MKKFRLLSAIICLLAVGILFLTSCESKLDAPTGLDLDTDKQILSWNGNSKASGYAVMIGDTEKVTRATSYSLSHLDPGTYEIKVKALGDGEEIQDSEYAIYEFIKKPESGLLYQLINDNTEYELIGAGSATGDVVMEPEFRGKPVTSIAEAALANNSKITSFTISENITSIPAKAFYNCSTLEKVSIPSGVTYIGEKAFQSCRLLTSVNIPDGVTEIKSDTFSYCRALSEVTGAVNVKNIGNYAFNECSALTSFVIPEGVTTIGDYAFSGCKALTSMELNDALVSIGDNAFYYCELVTEFDLGEKLESIGDSAFEACKGLTVIDLPNSLTTIGHKVFASCSSLATINGGANIRAVGNNVLHDTAYYNEYSDDVVYLGSWVLSCKNPNISEGKDLVLKDGIIGIADNAFAGCTGFTGVNLPDVEYIGTSAFNGCTNLMDFKVGESATTIGDYAFANCKLLNNVFIEDSSISYIGDYAFYGCERLSSLDLPNTVEFIGSQAFKESGFPASMSGVIYVDDWAVGTNNQGMMGLTLKDGTVGIAKYAFFGCQFIGTVTLPDSLERICKGAFMMCSYISINEFPDGLKVIDDYAFYACEFSNYGYKNNFNLVLPDSLEKIGRSAFYLNAIRGVEIPGSCEYIGDYAFYGCALLGAPETVTDEETGVETVTYHPVVLNEGIKYIGSRAFYGCVGLTEISIPDSVNEMGIRAFYNCTSLKKAELGGGIDTVPEYTFYQCTSLTDVIIPDNYVMIGRSAFYNCTSLVNLDIGFKLAKLDEYALRGCESLTHFVAPAQLTSLDIHSMRGIKNATYILLNNGVADIGQHALYSALNATIYCESAAPMSGWHERWNSSFRPVIWGCTLSSDGSYVVSFEKTAESIDNFDAINGIKAPMREGYEFAGWATSADGAPVYAAENVMDAPDGTTLYAVWQSKYSN